MKQLIRLAVGLTLVGAAVPMFAGSAAGHGVTGTTISCSEVTGTFQDFGAQDHPIVWHVEVGAGASQAAASAGPFQALPTVETPPGFVGTGTASADIGALTAGLHGATATVQAFATWPGGQSSTVSEDVTCGVPQVTPTVPPASAPSASGPAPQVAGISALAPNAAASAAVPVPAAATFTG